MRRVRATVVALGLAALAGCTSGAEQDSPLDPSRSVTHDGLVYQAQTNILESYPVQLATVVTVANPSDEPQAVTFPDGCIVLIRVYDNEDRSGEPVWDQARAIACTMALVERRVPAEGREEFAAHTSAAEVLGDSLPDGRYYFSALIRPNGDAVELPAGAAELAVPR